jgi:hypothetical protein
LIEHLQVHAFALQDLGDLAQVQGGAGQPIQAREHQRIARVDVLQAGLKTGPRAGGAALRLLIDLVAAGELVELDGQALAHRADPGVADARRRVPLPSQNP